MAARGDAVTSGARSASTSATSRAHDSSARFDSISTTGSHGLTNARTRIVGERTGVLADSVVALVRAAAGVRSVGARVLGRITSVVTPVGWAVAVAAPVALGVGYGFGVVEFVVLGWALLALVLLAILYLLGRSPVDLVLALPHSRVVVGESASAEVVARNPARRRTLGLTVDVPVGPGIVEVAVPGLAPGAESTRQVSLPSVRRGVVSVGPVSTVRADPVGVVRREVVWGEAGELIVHPRTISIPSMSTGLIRDLEGNPTRDLATNDVSFHALREYVPGDERRYIHWRSTARTGTYMVRQFEETRRSHLVIALSLAARDYADDEEFELAVSVAGSLGTRAIRDARTLTMVVGASTPDFAKRKVYAVRPLSTLSRTRLLDDLAVVERAESALAITDVARVTGDQAAGVSVAFLICGSGVTAQELRAASTKFPMGVEVVAVVCDPETTPGLRRVAGLSVITIGFLEDLQQALARSAAA